jgi:DNA-binding response OmpR family regulator
MTPPEAGRPRGIGPRDVLVVEDDESISKLLKIVLENNGYIVRIAKDYATARTAIEDGEYAIMLFDIGLPDGNGLELVRWVRDDLTQSTPIIVLSAFRQDENVQRAFEFGANDFVPKPFRPKELMARVERVIER